MRVILAEKAGACYGVERALDLALSASRDAERAYTVGPLIHNPRVVADLENNGVFVAESLDDVEEGTLIIRSHGVTPEVRDAILAKGLPVVDATCPHVTRAQQAAGELGRLGCRVIVVGEKGHPEVQGLCAYAQAEGAKVDVVPGPDDVPAGLCEPVGVVVQTTQRKENLEAIIERIEAQGIKPLVKRTICSATSQRQNAAAALANDADAMLVIGGRNSSNTTRLAEICRSSCEKTHHIESAEEIDPAWFDGCTVVGVTAGASTPSEQIQAVIDYVESLPNA